MTGRLYLKDPYLHRFRGRVVASRADPFPALALDQTAFYPGGGGQPPDRGWIAGWPVAGVSVDPGDPDTIWHRLGEVVPGQPLPEPGTAVDCELDWDRRFDFMQQHTGQHIISAVALAGSDAPTTGFHLTEETATVDLAFPGASGDNAERTERLLAGLEHAACAEVFADRPLRLHLVAPGETPQGGDPGLSLRVRQHGPAPKTEGQWRVVEIEGLDLSPCGGTHVRSTGQVGLIAFQGWEKVRDSVRVEFACGWRALAAGARRGRDLKRLARELSVHEREAVDQALQALGEAGRQAKELSRLRGALLAYEAAGLCGQAEEAGGARLVCRVLAGRSLEELKHLATAIAGRPGCVALLASADPAPMLVFARAEDVNLDVRGPLATTVGVLGGRGGGTARIAQGGGGDPASLDRAMSAASAEARRLLTGKSPVEA